MPSIKNRWVKPGGSFNWTEGVKVYNKTGAELGKYAAVQVQGIRGGIGEVQPANATSAAGVRGRILFMRHATPAGEYGVATPWILIEGQNTNATNVGDPWWIDATGNGTLVAASGGLTGVRVVGKTIVKDATNGAIELADTMALP